MDKCTHETSEVDSVFEGFSVLLCTWECGEALIELDLGNHQVATYTAAELAALTARVAELEAALKPFAEQAHTFDDGSHGTKDILGNPEIIEGCHRAAVLLKVQR